MRVWDELDDPTLTARELTGERPNNATRTARQPHGRLTNGFQVLGPPVPSRRRIQPGANIAARIIVNSARVAPRRRHPPFVSRVVLQLAASLQAEERNILEWTFAIRVFLGAALGIACGLVGAAGGNVLFA